MTAPRQGEIWLARLEPIVGGEIAKTRPVLVMSVDSINKSPVEVSIVAPITTTPLEVGVRVELPQTSGQPRRVSYVLPNQVRTLSHQRLVRRVMLAELDVRREVARRLAVFTKVS